MVQNPNRSNVKCMKMTEHSLFGIYFYKFIYLFLFKYILGINFGIPYDTLLDSLALDLSSYFQKFDKVNLKINIELFKLTKNREIDKLIYTPKVSL